MVPSITALLPRFTDEWSALRQPDAILTVCGDIGDTGWRDRVLTPVTTVPLCLLQMLPGHTACRHWPHLSGWRFSAAAYGQARAKLPRHLFALRLEHFSRAVPPPISGAGRWPGHRTVLVDGSGGSRPDTPALQDAFGPPTAPRLGCGVPVAHLAPRLTHDRAQGQPVHPMVAPGDGLVADRGLGSDAPLALLVQAGVHAVRRVGARQMVDCTPGRPLVRPSGRRTSAVTGVPRARGLTALGVQDPRVAWLQPKTGPSWLTREALATLPET